MKGRCIILMSHDPDLIYDNLEYKILELTGTTMIYETTVEYGVEDFLHHYEFVKE